MVIKVAYPENDTFLVTKVLLISFKSVSSVDNLAFTLIVMPMVVSFSPFEDVHHV